MKPNLNVIQRVPVWLPQTQTWIYNQTKYLPDDITSHIVCETVENLDQFHLENIHPIAEAPLLSRFRNSGLKGTKLLSKSYWLWMMCRKIKPDIVHSHFGTTAWFDAFIVRLTKAKHVVTFYGLDVNMIPTQEPKWKKRYKALFKSADLFLCEGPHMAMCINALGCPKEKIRVHHLGVEVDKIIFKPRTWNPKEPLRVLIASSLREKKGIPYALEALSRVKNKVNLEITIIGDAVDQDSSREEKKRILQVMQTHDMQPIVRMLGFQPYSVLFEEAYKHHIFISPSVCAADGDTEGGAPVTIIEMIATGMPVVSTTHCDIPEVIINNETGLLAEERNVEHLVSHLNRLIEHPDLWDNMIRAGRTRIENQFDVRKQAYGLGEYYKHLVKD
jgi:colanic acid/amylovoran biosynthesis glycosyltransferase